MSLTAMQTDLEVVAVQESRIDRHPSLACWAIYTVNGWKNVKTGEVKWGKVNIKPLGEVQER